MQKDWDDLRFFLAAARTGSLGRAAEFLGVSQPTVRRRLRDLERHLNATLLERTTDGYTLTQAGHRILDLVEEIERQVDTVGRRVLGADQRISGSVSISVTAGLARNWLIPRLPALTGEYPGLDVEVSVGLPRSDLMRRETDIAVRFGDPGSPDLVGRRLGRLSCGLYASRAYLQARGTPQSVKELDRHDIIEATRGIEALEQSRRLRELARGARVSLRCDDVDAQLAAARAGFGIVPLFTYMRLKAPELVRVLADRFDVPMDIWLVTHDDVRDAARVRCVLDFLWASFQEDLPMLADRR
jgi:DNA-binding transcriptional LysR family regulator